MGLINLTTNLKSNKFGHDRPGGGSSNQPYVQTFIPTNFGVIDQDFLLRGGSKAITNSILDVERLGKYFLDVRNPSGLLFIAKQNLLSRTAVRTQTSGLILNEGIYTPISTLTQAAGNAFGIHVNKQGLDPSGFSPFSIGKYEDEARREKVRSYLGSESNRLVLLADSKIYNEIVANPLTGISSNPQEILNYSGGPGSILGIGRTHIRFADQRTGKNAASFKQDIFKDVLKLFRVEKSTTRLTSGEYLTYEGDHKSIPIDPYENLKRFLGLSTYPSIYSGSLYSQESSNPNFPPVPLDPKNNLITYTAEELVDINTEKTEDGSSFHIGDGSKGATTTPGDFRVLLRKRNQAITKAPNYTEKNVEARLKLGDPGNKNGKNLTSYTFGYNETGAASADSYDELNKLEPQSVQNPKEANDLVKFRIGIMGMENDNVGTKTYIHFRAFLNSISDQYNAEWNSTKYVGRGENFYTYSGFDRKVSLSWTVAAQSKVELIPMYKKLNYLASIVTPNYSDHGYMRGNIVTLTVGGYFYEQPGIITGFQYEMNDDNATWEIGINDDGLSDPTVKELPHLIKVTGFNFIPIHDFVPRLQKEVNGSSRYIALSDGANNNYE